MDEGPDHADELMTLFSRAVAEIWPQVEGEWMESIWTWFPRRYTDTEGFVSIARLLLLDAVFEWWNWFDQHREEVDREFQATGIPPQELPRIWREARGRSLEAQRNEREGL